MASILVIEDDPSNAALLRRLLETSGHQVDHSFQGLEGARRACRTPYDLILLDFDLPDIDGRALLLMMKQQLGSRADTTPIVAVTARTGLAEERMARQFGCTDFIGKPFSPQDFLARVAALVGEPNIQAS